MNLHSSPPDVELLRTQIRHLSEAGASAYFFSLFAISIISYTLWEEFPANVMASWVFVTSIVTLARYLHFRGFDPQQSDEALIKFHRYFVVGTLIAAACWGALSFSIANVAKPLNQAVIILVIFGVCGGSVLVSSALVQLTRAFVFITLTPLLCGLFLLGTDHLILVALTIGMGGFLNHLASSIFTSVVESYKAHLENQNLIAQLKDSKKSAEAINRQLKTEIAVRNKAEAHMVEARDKAEQAARAKSDFLATMSHEIRTPMNGVLGMTELLMNTDLSAKQFRFADTIRRSGEALLCIINDILDFSKIDAGKLEIQHTVFDLRQLVEDTASFFAEGAQTKRIELVSNFPPNEHAAYRGDPDRIRQILMNLIGNALKFTEHGEISIVVSTVEKGDDETTIKFEVSDSGVGIAEEHQAHIFESFQQADASTTRKFGGTGLGLAICSRLVTLMHGQIGVNSTLGKGATFWFTVKLTPAPSSAITNQIKNDVNFAGLKVLVVDDNETNREVLEHQLANWQMKPQCVASGSQALKFLNRSIDRNDLYDLVILDRQMPEIDGVELAQRIRNNEHLKSVAIVMLSSINQLEETGQWYSAGIDVYVNKPVRQADLYEGLCVALEDRNKIAPNSVDMANETPAEEAQSLHAEILIAEDNPINQELARTMLENLACNVVVVDNGLEAVKAITDSPLDQMQRPYDILLMDCQMPELDGFQATQKIRRWEESQNQHLPIIALTANAMSGDREKCLEAGMDDYLSKPFTQEQLFDICKKWLSLETKTKHDLIKKKADTAERTQQLNASPIAELDATTLNNIRALQRDGGPDILAKVVNLYLKNAPPLLEKIQEATATGNAQLLRATAHSLKSSSANVGATRLAELCAELETMGRENTLDNAMSTLGILEFEFESVCHALQVELNRDAA